MIYLNTHQRLIELGLHGMANAYDRQLSQHSSNRKPSMYVWA